MEIDEIPPPLPIYHHPLVAMSLILTVAALVQIGAWLLSLRLAGTAGSAASPALVHGLLFERGAGALSQRYGGPGNAHSLVFSLTIALSMLSGCAWFGAARLALGPRWGLWTGLAWVMHPAFAIAANRGGALGLEITLTSLIALSLCRWRYRGNRWWAAGLTGVLTAGLALTASVGSVVCGASLLLALASHGRRGRRLAGAAAVLAGFAATMGLFIGYGMSGEERLAARTRMAEGFRAAIMNSALARPAATQSAPATQAASTVVAESPQVARRSPWAHARWYAVRLVRMVYATADGRFERPLLALQLMCAVPALWGVLIAMGYPPWRWLTGMAVCFVLSFWGLGALLEPLARNLTPIGGFGVIFGLIGCADAYERFFGRRLLGGGEEMDGVRGRW